MEHILTSLSGMLQWDLEPPHGYICPKRKSPEDLGWRIALKTL